MRTLIAVSMLTLAAAPVLAQGSDFQWSKAEPAGTVVSVHDITGDISFVPGAGSTVEVTARRHGADADVYTVVKEYDKHVVVCVLYRDTDESCDEEGAHMQSHDRHWGREASMDVTVKLPASMMADARSVSGDVHIDGAHGDVHASSVSGDLTLRNLSAAAVRATTVSGDVDAGVTALSGDGELVFRSVSGDVTVAMPASLDADFSMSTVSGDLDTDFPLTLSGRMGRRRIEARIGKGGRRFSVSTVSGDVRLHMIK
ncbi:MAG: DUF4097 family beta strand repeat protein [Gemmatimonadota bacterium]|nr:DUF4097 family beta strand repeat protein [Gemmatimonadota bacterium]